MKKTHEEQADEYVEMFESIDYMEELPLEEANYICTQCAIKHVEGLISLAKNLKLKLFKDTNLDYSETSIVIESECRNLISVKAVLEQRIHQQTK